MARPKAFDRDVALHAGMHVFWRHGLEATTTDELPRPMGIGRQSFYDTFGGKRSCFLDALRHYVRERIGTQVAALRAARSPPAAVRALLRAPADGGPDERALGCLVVNALAEVGGTADDVRGALEPGGAELVAALTDSLREARTRGEVAAVDERQAALLLLTVRAGLMVHAKAGWTPEALRQTADLAVDLLRVPGPIERVCAGALPAPGGPHAPTPPRANVPANAPHTFRARGETATRLLCMCTPAGQEEFFREVGVPLPTRTSAPPPPDPEVRARHRADARARTRVPLGDPAPVTAHPIGAPVPAVRHRDAVHHA